MPAGSHIVFISASLCHPNTVQPRHLPYCLNRGTIEQIARILSNDLAPKGVIVNSIAPGPAGTEMFRRGKPESMVEEIKRQSPFNILGEPEKIADAVLFMTATTWVAGQTLRCNGSLD
jgi:3-oxoacyl-[acyl-carrier protein] reductase